MIKTRINNEYKDIIKIFGGGTLQKEITKIWSGEASKYVYESEVEYTGTLPITITTDGTALIDYCIYGNTVQSGTPMPEAPVDVAGCGVRTANLYNINAKDINNGYVNNAQLTQDGTFTTWGSAEVSEYIPISGDTAYTFNGVGSYNSPCYALYDENKQLIGAYKYNGATIIRFTSLSDARYFRFTHIKTFSMAMLVEGSYTSSTMPEYEPYGYKLPILSNSTVTNIYLGEVETTRRIKKLALDGTELWIKSSSGYNAFYFYMTSEYPHPKINSSEVICNIATFTRNPDNYIRYPWFCVSDSAFGISTDSAVIGGAKVADWKSYLAAQYANGTPVTIWYVLAEPETGVVNEPLMKIGNYVDTISMEQADVSIPTVACTTVIDYDGAPKPSQMYIKYRR